METTLYNTTFSRSSGRQLPFSTRLEKLADIPSDFRKTVVRLLEGREENVRHILYTPEFGTFGEYCPATLFIVTNHEWLAFSAEKAGAPTVCYADFTQTRLIEFSLALLQGCLILESGEAGEPPCILRFNLTSRELFHDALCVILNQGVPLSSRDLLGGALPAECEKLSFGIRSTLRESLTPSNPLLELVSWSRADVANLAERHRMHAGSIVLTEYFLMLVRADDPVDRGEEADLAGYNRGVVFLNRAFSITGRVRARDGIDELEITVGREPLSSAINVPVPRGLSADVLRMLSPLGMGEKAA